MNLAKTWGGGEKWHLDHALALRDEGHDVHVIADRKGEFLIRAQKSGLSCYPFSAGNLGFLNPFKTNAIYRFFKVNGFDVLVMNFSKDLKLAAPMARLAGIPAIVYRRGSAIPIKNTLINRFLYGHCLTHMLANSEATKRTILQNNPNLFPADKIKVIYNGIAIHDLSTEETQSEIPVIGNLGRLVYQKGQDILIDIAKILRDRDIRCLFRIGGEGALMNELQQKVQANGLTQMVEFTGLVNDPEAFMKGIDIFALTSRWEGFGYVLAEAMLAGKPLVAFKVSSNAELVFPNENGFLVDWDDKDAFADAIIRLIRQPSLRKRMGENGYSLVCDRFDFEKNKKQVTAFLTQTVKEK
ncbi:MAG: glycosyltransferase family 4 protein [Bacteroidota bacterium]|nr:glycosyltransferase family 4 protein [Bacteroidota bacterium]